MKHHEGFRSQAFLRVPSCPWWLAVSQINPQPGTHGFARIYRNTTTATRMPRIRTTTANRLTWSASHDSCGGTAFARKAGTNSSGVTDTEVAAEAPTEPELVSCSCSA